MASGARGGIRTVTAVEQLMTTTARYQSALGVQAADFI